MATDMMNLVMNLHMVASAMDLDMLDMLDMLAWAMASGDITDMATSQAMDRKCMVTAAIDILHTDTEEVQDTHTFLMPGNFMVMAVMAVMAAARA